MGVIFKDYLETGENRDLKDVTVNTDSTNIFFMQPLLLIQYHAKDMTHNALLL